jgi:signal transduction histidine kinase
MADDVARSGRSAGRRDHGRLQNLFRTTAFKLSFAYLLIFTTFAFLALGYVAWNASRVLDDQMVSTIEAEISGLSEQYKSGGLRRLISVVERRAGEPGASLYLVTTPAGEHVAGNVGALPAGLLAEPGQTEAAYARGGSSSLDHRAIMRIFTLPGGFRLVVGRDVEERDRLRSVIGGTFGTSLLLVILLGVVGGWFVASRVLKRVDAMTETTRRIMAGDLGGRLAVAGNRDELDRLARNLNEMLERIGELMRGLREVSDNIAHDLKTPLTRLRNRADEALRSPASAADLRLAMEGVIEDSDGLIRVFNALLMIARLEGVSAHELMAEFDVGTTAREVGELYEAVAADEGLSLDIVTTGDLRLVGSRELIGQALANLIDNAVKYGAMKESVPNRDGGCIRISAERIGCAIRVVVADRGPGIPAEARGRVLDRFVRLEDARSRPGFGLGLSLVAAIVRLHQGTLVLNDNAPGLAVVVTLPALAVGDPA